MNLYGHTNFENGFEVQNYPWGFKLKTLRKYWVETTKRGDRFCFVTLNPKTNQWCKPKKGTYAAVVIMFLDENNYVKNKCLHLGYDDEAAVKKFLDDVDYDQLSLEQKKMVCQAKTINHVNSKIKVTFKVVAPTKFNQEKADEEEAKKKEQDKLLNNYANHVYGKCLVKNNLIKGVK
tara:strand:+ start:6633 stop:7163 length:531 start_codon:yes stop_codon:yes gene_type:complete